MSLEQWDVEMGECFMDRVRGSVFGLSDLRAWRDREDVWLDEVVELERETRHYDTIDGRRVGCRTRQVLAILNAEIARRLK